MTRIRSLAKSALRLLRPVEVEGNGAHYAAAIHEQSVRGAAATRRIFFLRGHPRSGTNWVGAILNLHPKICCHGEFHLEQVRDGIAGLQAQTWQPAGREPLKGVLDQCFHDMVRRCVLTLVPRKPGASWIGDRTPRELSPLLPGSPHFLLVRDGRDVAVSWTFHLLKSPPEVVSTVLHGPVREAFLSTIHTHRDEPEYFKQHPHSLFQSETWVRYVASRWATRAAMDAAMVKRMQSGDADGRVHVVKYEAIHADTENERARMYEFLGLDPAEAAPLSAGDKTTPGFEREDPRSFFRKGEVGDWRGYATDNFRRWFTDEAGAALVEQGYESGRGW